MEDILQLGIDGASIDWDYVAEYLMHTPLECRETALRTISQLLGGERLDIIDETTNSTMLWKPDLIAANVIEDRHSATSLLFRSVTSCVRSWASSHETLLVRLSGGLDSSIVASCLAHGFGSPNVICVNYHWPGSESDERYYARQVAEYAKRQIIERQRDAAISIERIFAVERTPKPSNYLSYLEYGPTEAELTQETGATAVFTGDGGDQLFYQMTAVWPGADYLYAHGLRGEPARAVLDAARLGRRSFWNALGPAVLNGLLRMPIDTRPDSAGFLTLLEPHLFRRERSKRFLHPAQSQSFGLPPGKFQQICYLLFPTDYYDPFGHADGAEHIYPLLSQPIIEACLRIPTFVLAHGGRGRALAREAFSPLLPPQVANRRSKGSVDEPRKLMMLRNFEMLRAELPEGLLVSKGILNRGKLHEALAATPTKVSTSSAELFHYLSAEAWARRWTHFQRTVAA
jgi:asparagine synthase (glutamine-hydrolysing)